MCYDWEKISHSRLVTTCCVLSCVAEGNTHPSCSAGLFFFLDVYIRFTSELQEQQYDVVTLPSRTEQPVMTTTFAAVCDERLWMDRLNVNEDGKDSTGLSLMGDGAQWIWERDGVSAETERDGDGKQFFVSCHFISGLSVIDWMWNITYKLQLITLTAQQGLLENSTHTHTYTHTRTEAANRHCASAGCREMIGAGRRFEGEKGE